MSTYQQAPAQVLPNRHESTERASLDASQIAARIDCLPACRATWLPAVLVSLAAIFEAYDLYLTAYLPPGLIRDGLFSAGAGRLFGLPDQATFGSMTFLGLFIGATCFTSAADRFGRRVVFLYALLGYSIATAILALQTTAVGVFAARLFAGIGLGVELVTIDSYLVELMPSHMRGRAFALNSAVQYLGVPAVALFSWLLIPVAPLGIAGWRWVVLAGSSGALLAWYLRRGLPESPRWLALHGRTAEAERVVIGMETRVMRTGLPLLPAPFALAGAEPQRGRWLDLWRPPYRRRTVMLIVFNLFQTIGFFGFTNWLPALFLAKGHDFTRSLFYSFCIAWAYPLSSLFWYYTVAERFERKWLIVAAALGVCCVGPLFALVSYPPLLVTLGILITGFSVLLSFSYHAYQAELYPTAVRARAVGFVYSFSRISTAFTSYLVAFSLARFGVSGVFALITMAMLMVVVSIGGFGPRTRAGALHG